MTQSPFSHIFAPEILREYDIRGQIGKNLGPADAYAVGRVFGSMVREGHKGQAQDICVGYDGRHSSPLLAEQVASGIVASGNNVVKIGLGPSPMLYYAVKSTGAAAGIMVTGSHNPADFNGFKMMLQTGPFYGEAILALGKIAGSGNVSNGDGNVKALDIRSAYVHRLLKDYTAQRPLTIAWDAGNGAAGEALRMLTAKLPGTHHLLFDDIDGNFPNHHPDPTVDKNLEQLRALVLEKQCDLGIAFDGDGDRIGVVDDQGRILRCDMLMTIYARDVLAAHPGAAIIGDVKCSQIMFDEIARLGGRPVMWKTGHSLIKAKMAELNAPLAGELSGHIFFADKYYGYDDALYCAVRLINMVGAGGLSAITGGLPEIFNTPEIRFTVKEEDKFRLIEEIAASIKSEAGVNINRIDGVRVETPDGWWLVRASNTQSVLVARAESQSESGLLKLKSMARAALAPLGLDLRFEQTDH